MTESAPPIKLKKLTTTYDKVEDRIRVDAQAESGEPQSFWLTQRLCGELVRTMVRYFNQAGLAYSDPSPQSQGEVQRFLHQSARTGKRKVAAVSGGRRRAALLNSIRVRTSDKFIQLLLPLSENQQGTVVFSPNEARQWLDILYGQYRAAEWRMDIWPEWMSDSGEGQPQADNSRRKPLH